MEISHIMFAVVASMSVIGNCLLCCLLLSHPSMLNKTYNLLILNLAVTDVLGGIMLFVTPGYVVSYSTYSLPLSGHGGEVFCRIVFSTYLLFVCGKASNATIMCLSIERWYAVVKPSKYKSAFKRRRLYIYIAIIWLSAAVTEVFELFIAKLDNGSCQWIVPFYGAKAENAFLVLHVMVTFYIPSCVTWVSFIHIWIKMKSNSVSSQSQRVQVTKSVVRMCALASFFLTVCWFPTETFWVLKKFQVVILTYNYYLVFNLLAFFSSCVNPLIYCLSNKYYRREALAIIRRLYYCRRDPRVAPTTPSVAPSTQNSTHDDTRLNTQGRSNLNNNQQQQQQQENCTTTM